MRNMRELFLVLLMVCIIGGPALCKKQQPDNAMLEVRIAHLEREVKALEDLIVQERMSR